MTCRSLLVCAAITGLFAGCSASTTSATPSVSPPLPVETAVVNPSFAAPGSAAVGLRYVAVGDSIPYGADDCGCQGFPTPFGDWIAKRTGRTVDTRNMSQHDSNTAARMAVEIAGRSDLQDALRGADIITLTIGHNDTPWNATDDACDADQGVLDGNAKATWQMEAGPCLQTEVERYRANLASILDQILALRAGKPTAIRFTTQYNDIPGDPCCFGDAITVSGQIKDAYNAAACEVVVAHGAICVDIYHAFNGPNGTDPAGDLLAGDHTHPSAAGHQKIAELLENAGLAPIT